MGLIKFLGVLFLRFVILEFSNLTQKLENYPWNQVITHRPARPRRRTRPEKVQKTNSSTFQTDLSVSGYKLVGGFRIFFNILYN